MDTHIMLVEPDATSALLFGENIKGYMEDARVTVAHSDVDAMTLIEVGVRPDVALVVWGGGGLRGASLVHTLRGSIPDLPILLVVEEDTRLSQSELESLNVQAVLTKPFFFPGLVGAVKEAVDWSPAPASSSEPPTPAFQADAVADSPDEDPLRSLATMLEEPLIGTALGGHIELTKQQTSRLSQEMKKISQKMERAALLLSQDGALVSHGGGASRDSATAMARLAGRVWREGATRPAREWLYFSDQIPSEGGERRSVALYSVVVAGDLTLSVAWDGIMSFSALRTNALDAAGALGSLLS